MSSLLEINHCYTTSTDSIVQNLILKFKKVSDTAEVPKKTCGFHLSKSKWDPYPWVEHVEDGSIAYLGGLRAGDCLLNIDGKDLLGLKVKDVASLIYDKSYEESVNLFVWRNDDCEEHQEDVGLALRGPLPEVARKLASAITGVLRIIECPICLETVTPPVSQCVHGHIICMECRPKTSRCPVCRVRLGQGRCLLADKLDKVLRDTFEGRASSSSNDTIKQWSLRQYLFGRRPKKQEMVTLAVNNSTPLKPRQVLLSRLLGHEKAISAENLSMISTRAHTATLLPQSAGLYRNLNEQFSSYDRSKSASTGELSNQTKYPANDLSMPVEGFHSECSSTSELPCNVAQTPKWGGSVDSVTSTQITCPFPRRYNCKELLTSMTVMEHINKIHLGPKIHFYGGSAQIPIPLPFGFEGIYLLHHEEDIFFFQYEDESACLTSATVSNGFNSWEWLVHGLGENGTEVKLRRSVANFTDPTLLSPMHIAPLPKALSLYILHIQLLECRANETSQI